MAAKTMSETVALIGQQVETVSKTVAKIDANVEQLKTAQATTDIHVKSIIGPPSLEDRVNKSMDDKDNHKHANVMQAITGTQEILRLQQENATLRMDASIASVAETLKLVAQSVEHTEAMRKSNHEAQLKWQEKQESESKEAKAEDVKWKQDVERKINIFLGALIALEGATVAVFKYLDWIKH